MIFTHALNTSNGMVDGESIGTSTNQMFLGITGTGTKKPIMQSYTLNMITKTCTEATATSLWNNETQKIPALGADFTAIIGEPLQFTLKDITTINKKEETKQF